MNLKLKKLNENAILPNKGSKEAAGLDFYLIEDFTLGSYESKMIPTGWAIEIQEGYALVNFTKGGIGVKRECSTSIGATVVDSDYRGEVFIQIFNFGEKTQKFYKGDKIAQFLVLPVPNVNLMVVDELNDSQRGEGRLGSTGTRA